MNREKLEAEALKLNPKARAHLAGKLLESLEQLSEDDSVKLWAEEAQRRDEEMDLRPGGALRWVWRDTKTGAEMGLRGEYREVTPPARFVHTELYDEDWTGGETVVTITFEERAGRTTVAVTVLYSSKEARDGALKTPMAEGMEMGYERLERLLASMSAPRA